MQYQYPLFLLLSGLSLHSIAQSPSSPEGSPSPLSTLKAVTVELSSPKNTTSSSFSSLFSHFEVLDERPDTARIGIYTERFKAAGSRSRQLVLTHPAAREISNYLDARFAQSAAPYTALIVIRTLWISDANNVLEELVKSPDKFNEKTKVRLKAEVYAKKDSSYIPLFRFDSLNIALKGFALRSDYILSDMLSSLADSSILLLMEKGGEGRKISREEIVQFNQSRFGHPICNDDAFVKGIYMNFEEFRNNAPSIRNYEVKKAKGNLILYIHEAGGNTYYSHNAWGYCDGKTIYIMKDGFLEPAWKEGKTWYFYSQVSTEDPNQQRSGFVPIMGLSPEAQLLDHAITPGISAGVQLLGNAVGASTQENGMTSVKRASPRTHIFTVDMDTGKLY